MLQCTVTLTIVAFCSPSLQAEHTAHLQGLEPVDNSRTAVTRVIRGLWPQFGLQFGTYGIKLAVDRSQGALPLVATRMIPLLALPCADAFGPEARVMRY